MRALYDNDGENFFIVYGHIHRWDAGPENQKTEVLTRHIGDEAAEIFLVAVISVEGNAGLCRGLLATRYGIPDPEEVAL